MIFLTSPSLLFTDGEDSSEIRVSPASDPQHVSIATEAEVRNVIDFLSRSQTYNNEPFDDYPPDRDHAYSSGSSYFSEYQDGGKDWSQAPPPASAPPTTKEKPAHSEQNPAQSDNSSSGSSGVGTDDGYAHLSHDSRSTSMSPGAEGGGGSGGGEGLGSGGGGEEEEGKRYNKGSLDSGINLHTRHSSRKKKGWDQGAESQRMTQELFGPLISSAETNSDPCYGMLGHLQLLGDDSDSERSG